MSNLYHYNMTLRVKCQGDMMETLDILGQRLRELRKEKKMRQEDMANVLGVTLRHYHRIEHGEINIPTLALCQLADYFGVTTEYLLGRSDQR